ncbi:hypothetical protein CCHL11_05295 [Colletotrichum chlorophyti]|uniref:Uncharacterized protein n=1 Tax=Colletotrichum chlorophyti TaxID=708187 RepID=A0A1Q8RP89_9PEZI|nr:hypothetical protein CCHL11_05295 [Colletotrichum chlorophyti]
MRSSTVILTLLATLAAAAPSYMASVDTNSLIETRQCAAAGVCSAGGDRGESCSALKCCSDSKSGRGGGVG